MFKNIIGITICFTLNCCYTATKKKRKEPVEKSADKAIDETTPEYLKK